MKRFILKRVVRYVETVEIEVESWQHAKIALDDDELFKEIGAVSDKKTIDEKIEFTGDIV